MLLLLLDCFMTPRPLEVPLEGTAGTMWQRLFCSAKPHTSAEVLVMSSAAPGRCRRVLPWSCIAFWKDSTAWEDGNPQSNVTYAQTAVSQATDLPVHLYYSQTAISAANASDRQCVYLKSIVFPPREMRDFTKIASLYILSQFRVQPLK